MQRCDISEASLTQTLSWPRLSGGHRQIHESIDSIAYYPTKTQGIPVYDDMGLCKATLEASYVPMMLVTILRIYSFHWRGIQLDRMCSKSTVAIYMKHFAFSTMMR